SRDFIDRLTFFVGSPNLSPLNASDITKPVPMAGSLGAAVAASRRRAHGELTERGGIGNQEDTCERRARCPWSCSWRPFGPLPQQPVPATCLPGTTTAG